MHLKHIEIKAMITKTIRLLIKIGFVSFFVLSSGASGFITLFILFSDGSKSIISSSFSVGFVIFYKR